MFARIRWTIVLLIFICGAVSYLDRAALSVAAPLVAKDLQLDPAQLGIAFSTFFVGYTLFCFVGGYASDKIGPKNVFTLAITGWSVFCGLTAAAFSLPFLLVVRTIFGMGEGPFSATATKLVSNWVPRQQQATAMGLLHAGQPLGAALAGPVVGFISVTYSWRVSFIVIAAVGLIWVLFWVRMATDRPEQHKRVTPAELAELSAETESAPPAGISLGRYLTRPAILATAYAFFGYAYILYFFLSWFPSYLTMEHHLSVQRMGFVSTIPWLIGFLGLASGGFMCDWLYRRTGNALFSRKLLLVVLLTVAAACVALAGIVTDLVGAVTLMAVSVFCMYATANAYFAIVLDTVEPGRVGGVMGFVHLIANCAGVVAPTVTGYLIQWTGSFASSFIVTGALAVSGALAVALAVKSPKQPSVAPVAELRQA